MNPLTQQARRDYAAEKRTDTLIAIGCGVVFAALCVAFLLK
jgi:hypothetical protein